MKRAKVCLLLVACTALFLVWRQQSLVTLPIDNTSIEKISDYWSTTSGDVTVVRYESFLTMEQRQYHEIGLHFSPDERYYLMANSGQSNQIYLYGVTGEQGELIFDFRSFFGPEADRQLNYLYFFWDVDSNYVWLSRLHQGELYRYSLATKDWEMMDSGLPGIADRFLWEDTLLIYQYYDDDYAFAIYNMLDKECRLLPTDFKPLPRMDCVSSDAFGEHVIVFTNDPDGEIARYRYYLLDVRTGIITDTGLPLPEHRVPYTTGLAHSLCFYPGTRHILSYIYGYWDARGVGKSTFILHNVRTNETATIDLGGTSCRIDYWNSSGTAFMSEGRNLVYLSEEQIRHVTR